MQLNPMLAGPGQNGRMAVGTARKQKGVTSATAQTALSAADFQRKVECERAAAIVIESFIDNPKSKGDLMGLVAQVERRHYACIVEERSLAGRCGYPLCSGLLPPGGGVSQRWKIDTVKNKVFETKDRNMFCSDACFTASVHFAQQLDETPLWVRDQEGSEAPGADVKTPPPAEPVTLLPYGPRKKSPTSGDRSIEGTVGVQVVSDRANSPTKPVKTCPDPIPKKDSAERICTAEMSGVTGVSNDALVTSRAISAGVEVRLTCPKLELEKSVDLLEELDKSEELDLKTKVYGAKTMSDTENRAKKIEKKSISSAQNERQCQTIPPEQETIERLENTGDVSESLSNSLNEHLSLSIDVNFKNAVTEAKSVKEELLITNLSMQPKKAPMIKRRSRTHAAGKDAQPYESIYQRVRSALVEWRTIDTLTHVLGGDEVARLHGLVLPSQKPLPQTSSDKRDSEKDCAAKMQRYLRGVPSALHEDPDVQKPGPRSVKSTEAGGSGKRRVRFEGASSGPEDASAAPPVDIALPTVDNREQMTVRRRILVDKLRLAANPLFPSILPVERAPLMNDIGALVCTFHLSSHNVMFRRPREWTVALLALLDVLARSNAELREALGRPVFRAYAKSVDGALATLERYPLDVFLRDTVEAVLSPVPLRAVHTL